MRISSKRVPIGWIVALFAIVLVAALPAVWASPLAEPLRQTVPNPDPTPTPRTVVCKIIEPCEFATMSVKVANEGTLPMEGCSLQLAEGAAIAYKYEGQALAAPYMIAVPTLLPGESKDISFETGLVCDDPAAMPCATYKLDVMLVCGDESTLVDQICIDAPCPVLPSVGK